MSVISVRFYRVLMPDDKWYAASGKSKELVALHNNVPVKNVKAGADWLRLDGVSVYWGRLRQPAADGGEGVA